MIQKEAIQKQEKEHKIIGYVTTTVVHILLFLLLWFLVLETPNPPLEYGGMGLTMALGTPDAGGPLTEPVQEASATEPLPETPEVIEQVATQDFEEAPAVAAPKEKVPEKPKKPVEKPKEPEEKPRVADAKSMMTKKDKLTASSGDGSAPGSEGEPDGKPNGSPNGKGDGSGRPDGGSGNAPGSGGNGKGFDYKLSGRSVTRRPIIEDNSREIGKVVLDIEVDRTGKVLRVTLGTGSTTLSPILIAKAKQAALETRFTPNPEAPETQAGTITINFKLKP